MLDARVDEWDPRDCVYEWGRTVAAAPHHPLLPPVHYRYHCPGHRHLCGTSRNSRTRPATYVACPRQGDCYCLTGCSRDRDDLPRSSVPQVYPHDNHLTDSGFSPRARSRLHLVLANTWLELLLHKKKGLLMMKFALILSCASFFSLSFYFSKSIHSSRVHICGLICLLLIFFINICFTNPHFLIRFYRK